MKDWDWDLDFWNSEDWRNAQLKLEEEPFNPGIDNFFLPFLLTPFKEVHCAIICQDPYPNPDYAMGPCLSVPNSSSSYIPPTLRSVLDEYVADLHLPFPTTTDLTPWAKQGVFLWNALPTCRQWESKSHDWPEWHELTSEIVKRLDKKSVVFVFMGSVARRHIIHTSASSCTIELCHPSPRASLNSSRRNIPSIRGSRLFTTINDELGSNRIDWRLR